MTKALALYSGGLDSTLAILLILRQGIEVTGISFLTHVGCGIPAGTSRGEEMLAAAEKFGFRLKLIDLSEKFLKIIKNPKFGYGKNMNPCLDCKILMLKEAKVIMVDEGFDFVITGEVLYQRPMSQRRDTLPKIEKEAGLAGYVVRPLSAKLLKPTIPEEKGVIDREHLCGFSGRSRKPQMALARELGLADYPQPAGGCLLTDPIYSFRLSELLAHTPDPKVRDLSLLRVGRHFRVSGDCRIIVGRDEKENILLEGLADSNDHVLRVEGYGSPIALVNGVVSEEMLSLAASMCARYSDAKKLPFVDVAVRRGGETFRIQTSPATDSVIKGYRIEPH